jgi:hypothetical protein
MISILRYKISSKNQNKSEEFNRKGHKDFRKGRKELQLAFQLCVLCVFKAKAFAV